MNISLGIAGLGEIGLGEPIRNPNKVVSSTGSMVADKFVVSGIVGFVQTAQGTLVADQFTFSGSGTITDLWINQPETSSVWTNQQWPRDD